MEKINKKHLDNDQQRKIGQFAPSNKCKFYSISAYKKNNLSVLSHINLEASKNSLKYLEQEFDPLANPLYNSLRQIQDILFFKFLASHDKSK